MKLNQLIALAGIVCVSASTASAAGSDVYITGSSAFRGTLLKYLRSKLTETRAVFDKAASTTDLTASVDGSTFIVMSGKFNGATTRTTFYLSFTGSVAGIRDVAGPVAQKFPVKPATFETDNAYLLNTAAPFGGVGGASGTTKDSSGNITSASTLNNPDIGFSDVFKASTIYTGSMNDTRVAVLPFVWITAPGGAAAGIANMTPQIAQTVFKGGICSLSQFSGKFADGGTLVYAVGRTDDSGTRLTAMAESGVGVSASLAQFFPVGNPVSSYTDVGNGGYVAGGDLSTAMKSATNATGGYSVAYVSTGDAESTTGATVLSHNGVTLPNTLTINPSTGVVYTSTEADAAATLLVSEGKYTFWGYEHLIDKNPTGDAAIVLTNFKAALPAAFDSGRKAVRLGDMHSSRATDGDIVTHN